MWRRTDGEKSYWRDRFMDGGNLQLAESWLGGLDSNQDNQIQNLMYCQLYDLPTRTTKKLNLQRTPSWGHFH
jgi:hypothetical protein